LDISIEYAAANESEGYFTTSQRKVFLTFNHNSGHLQFYQIATLLRTHPSPDIPHQLRNGNHILVYTSHEADVCNGKTSTAEVSVWQVQCRRLQTASLPGWSQAWQSTQTKTWRYAN
jgi:hypothetical protein